MRLFTAALVPLVAALVVGLGAASGSALATDDCTEGGATPTIVGTEGNDTLTGTAGVDVIEGLGGNDTIDGLGGDDTICGGDGNDTITGGDGSDGLAGGPGDDLLTGDAGDDIALYYYSAAAITVDLSAGTATGDGNDHLTSIESVDGSQFSDTLNGDENANTLLGEPGNDVLNAGEGDDFLSGTNGNDRMNGGGGEDTAFFTASDHGVTVNLVTQRAKGFGNDRLSGIEDVDGSPYSDVIIGNARRNWNRGFGGNDRITGAAGPDRLEGGTGNDTLDGGAGRDLIIGGPGRDRCKGEVRRSCP